MEQAPYYADVAAGPDGGAAWWAGAEDGTRIRVGAWPLKGARGTVLIFPGRTEYIEKYDITAADLAKRGYAALAVDWRGQGLADRLGRVPEMGHVRRFGDYQQDVRAALAVAERLDLPHPWHLLAHSMGGAIGLRALHEGLPVATAAFSAPMWQIVISPPMRPVAWAASALARPLGLGQLYSPGASVASYVLSTAFEDNQLTRDAAMFAHMQAQLGAHPDLVLGGPSLTWLNEALREMRALRALPAPPVPAYVAVGSREAIVEADAVRAVTARWPGARVETYPGAEHEILMEGPGVRARFIDAIVDLFEARAGLETKPDTAAAAG